MEDKPPEPPAPNVPLGAPFIIAAVVGVPLGGLVLTFMLFLVLGGLLQRFESSGLLAAVIIMYTIAALAILWTLVARRRRLDVVAGLIFGLGVGLLGGTTLCQLMAGGLSNMH